jgi:hypothetical protein
MAVLAETFITDSCLESDTGDAGPDDGVPAVSRDREQPRAGGPGPRV